MSAKKIKGIVIPRRLKWSTSSNGENKGSSPSSIENEMTFIALALNAARYSQSYLPDAQDSYIEANFKEVKEE